VAADTTPSENAARRIADDRKRMEVSLELTAPMMRDFAPPSAMPFHAGPKIVWYA
jgi:hypothetical protein